MEADIAILKDIQARLESGRFIDFAIRRRRDSYSLTFTLPQTPGTVDQWNFVLEFKGDHRMLLYAYNTSFARLPSIEKEFNMADPEFPENMIGHIANPFVASSKPGGKK
jgi:hypothetical protein